jgi:hypothetical protein
LPLAQPGLANGSTGYIKLNGGVYFEDLEDVKAEYRWVNPYPIINEISGDFTVLKAERDIDFGYAIAAKNRILMTHFLNILKEPLKEVPMTFGAHLLT